MQNYQGNIYSGAHCINPLSTLDGTPAASPGSTTDMKAEQHSKASQWSLDTKERQCLIHNHDEEGQPGAHYGPQPPSTGWGFCSSIGMLS